MKLIYPGLVKCKITSH